MKFDTAAVVSYSPTGTTTRVLMEIVEGMGSELSFLDATLPEAREMAILPEGDVLLVGMPVYSGRIAKEGRALLEKLRGDERPAVAVVVYGNRHYDDALLELGDLLKEKGFKVIAGAAFIGEHSFADEEYPTAIGRPDGYDMPVIRSFGAKVAKMLGTVDSASELPEADLPGKRPYKVPSTMPEGSPVTDVETCVHCGKCAAVCPVAAVDPKDPNVTDGVACTFCCACVKACPTGARMLKLEPVASLGKKMWDNFSSRREPEFFLPMPLDAKR